MNAPTPRLTPADLHLLMQRLAALAALQGAETYINSLADWPQAVQASVCSCLRLYAMWIMIDLGLDAPAAPAPAEVPPPSTGPLSA